MTAQLLTRSMMRSVAGANGLQSALKKTLDRLFPNMRNSVIKGFDVNLERTVEVTLLVEPGEAAPPDFEAYAQELRECVRPHLQAGQSARVRVLLVTLSSESMVEGTTT